MGTRTVPHTAISKRPLAPPDAFPHTGQAAAEVLAGDRARGGSLAMGHELVLVDLSLPGLSLPLVCDGDTINLLCKDRSQEMSWV